LHIKDVPLHIKDVPLHIKDVPLHIKNPQMTTQPTAQEIDGRISTLMRQRNAALDDVAYLAGKLAAMEHELADARKELAAQKPSEPAPA
jgi:predicted  nucleic acid-binding Zn-ribbon protein